MFLAFNKPASRQIVDAKADLMCETLHTLRTDKISLFFKHVRESQDMLPTDGTLKKILSSGFDKYSKAIVEKQIEYKGELPSREWAHKFNYEVMLVVDGLRTPEEAKQVLGLK